MNPPVPTWGDLKRQALHCPVLQAMFALRDGGQFSDRDALLWAAMTLSVSRLRAIAAHGEAMRWVPPPASIMSLDPGDEK